MLERCETMAITVGDRAPDFSLPAHDGQVVTLAGLLARGPVVLFFYPKDETAGCTAEACAFRDSYEAFLRSSEIEIDRWADDGGACA